MPGVPIMLNVTGRRCLVIGGGAAGTRRAAALVEAGAAVTVIAPEVSDTLRGMPIEIHGRAVEPGDIRGWFLIVLATSDEAVNSMVADRAREAGILVNRADDTGAGDVEFMAADRRGPLTVAVHTGGVSAAAAATIRTAMVSHLDPAWVRLLELAAPYRGVIQARFREPEQRTARLRRLTDAAALDILKCSGEAAFREHCETIASPSGT